MQLVVLLLVLLPSMAWAQTTQPASPNVVRGDVMYWEGEELIVKEISGREVRVHVNAETKIEGTAGRLKTGDKIEAKVTSEGHATSISLQIPGGSSSISP